MSLATELDKEIQNGRNGKVGVIPVAYERIGNYIDIARNTLYVVGGETGDGKTTLASDLFVINPIKWYLQNKPENMKLSVICFFMERAQHNYTARWLSRLIFEDTGTDISPKKILGRRENDQLSDSEYALVKKYYAVLDEWEAEDLLICHSGSKNPTGISKYLEAFARKHGTIHDKDKSDSSMDNILASRTYVPNHLNHIVLVIGDNSGILAPEGDGKTKTLVDKFSRTMREARDIYGFSPVIVQQLSRGMSDVSRQKLGELQPKLSDFADSSQTARDADVVLALFNPYNHSVSEREPHNGYDLKRLKDKWFRTYYRALYILKNSFDSTGMNFPMAIQPVYGILRTLARSNEIPESIYEEVTSGRYFLPTDIEREERNILQSKPFKGFGNREAVLEQVKQATT